VRKILWIFFSRSLDNGHQVVISGQLTSPDYRVTAEVTICHVDDDSPNLLLGYFCLKNTNL